MRNSRIRDYAGKRAPNGPKLQRAANQGKSLGGVATESGVGGKLTNDMFQASISKKGASEAWNPKGPSGK